jgi:hypothetical protein
MKIITSSTTIYALLIFILFAIIAFSVGCTSVVATTNSSIPCFNQNMVYKQGLYIKK